MEEFDGKEGRKMVVKTGDGHTARGKKKKKGSVGIIMIGKEYVDERRKIVIAKYIDENKRYLNKTARRGRNI